MAKTYELQPELVKEFEASNRPYAVMSRGHHNADDFREAVAAKFSADLDALGVDELNPVHQWHKAVPEPCAGYSVFAVRSGARGAYPVTIAYL